MAIEADHIAISENIGNRSLSSVVNTEIFSEPRDKDFAEKLKMHSFTVSN